MKYDHEKIETVPQLVSYFGKMRAYVETGKALDLSVRPWTKRRTDLQNRTLRYGEKIVADELGYTTDEVHHEVCCLYFGSEQYKRIDGVTDKRPVRTTTTNEEGERDPISTRDCASMFDFLQGWAMNEFGIHIPDPDPNYRQKIREQIEREEKQAA